MKKYSVYVFLSLLVLALGAYVWFGEIRKEERRQAAAEAAKQLFGVTLDDVDSVTVRYAHDTFSLVRTGKGTRWAVTGPVAAPADRAEAERYVRRILELKRDRILDVSPGRLNEFGLANPEIDVRFFRKDGTPAGRIRFGNANPAGTMTYVLCGADTAVHLVDDAVLPDVRKTAADLRDRSLCGLERASVNRLEVRVGGKPVLLQKAAGNYWRIIAPVHAVARQQVMDRMLEKLAYGKAMFFVDDHGKKYARYGLHDPAVTVTAWDREDRSSALMLGNPVPGPERHYYARRADREAVLIVERYVPETLRQPLAALRDSALVRLNKFDITGLGVTTGTGEYALFRTGDRTWKMRAADGTAGPHAPARLMDEVLEALVRLRYHRIVTDAPGPKGRYGLEPPRLALTVLGENGQLDKLVFGSRRGLFGYCSIAAGNSVYLINPELPDKLTELCVK